MEINEKVRELECSTDCVNRLDERVTYLLNRYGTQNGTTHFEHTINQLLTQILGDCFRKVLGNGCNTLPAKTLSTYFDLIEEFDEFRDKEFAPLKSTNNWKIDFQYYVNETTSTTEYVIEAEKRLRKPHLRKLS